MMKNFSAIEKIDIQWGSKAGIQWLKNMYTVGSKRRIIFKIKNFMIGGGGVVFIGLILSIFGIC